MGLFQYDILCTNVHILYTKTNQHTTYTHCTYQLKLCLFGLFLCSIHLCAKVRSIGFVDIQPKGNTLETNAHQSHLSTSTILCTFQERAVYSTAQSTYIYRAPQCMSPRRNWDSPNPSPASECALSPPRTNGGAHGYGDGRVPIRRLEKKLTTLPALCSIVSIQAESDIFSDFLGVDSS